MNDTPQERPFEPEPDGWSRFESAFDRVIKSPAPKDKPAPPPGPKRGRGRPRKS
jgi:hypothetical protein